MPNGTALFGILFVILATLNSAGYRYGASDQALYIPAVVRHLEPRAFPQDRTLIDTQARLMLNDEVIAATARLTRASLPHLFVALYVATLALLFAAAIVFGGRMYRTGWTVLALAAALTLRHAIAKTGANTLEGYFHPREAAFAFGILAAAAFLGRKDRAAVLLLVCVAVMHTTVALWFSLWLGVAFGIERPRARRAVAAVATVMVLGAIAVLASGAMAARFVRMDPDWLAVIADKDYLFPLSWPLNVWLTNLITVPIVVLGWRARRRAGLTVARETPLMLGALTLVLVFFVSLPFNAMRLAIAVQLQIPRIFWILDFLATAYLVWWLCEGRRGAQRRALLVALAIVLLSTARGVYSCFIEFPDRKIFAVELSPPDWRDAMRWARETDPRSGWLADPMHAVIFGSSVRAAGHRDVFLEQVKDRALAMYDRAVAMRVADRERALQSLAWNTPEGARALARRYSLDYLVTDRALDLPLAHRSGALFIYRIRSDPRALAPPRSLHASSLASDDR
jgi:hypothetical protein